MTYEGDPKKYSPPPKPLNSPIERTYETVSNEVEEIDKTEVPKPGEVYYKPVENAPEPKVYYKPISDSEKPGPFYYKPIES